LFVRPGMIGESSNQGLGTWGKEITTSKEREGRRNKLIRFLRTRSQGCSAQRKAWWQSKRRAGAEGKVTEKGE